MKYRLCTAAPARLTVAALALLLALSAIPAQGQNIEWTRQFGSASYDTGYAVVTSDNAVYIGGQTSGALPGQTHFGEADAFLRRYDASGNEVWTRQFGTARVDGILGVAADSSGIYVAGYTIGSLAQGNAGDSDAFVRKYDFEGNELWTRQFGSPWWDLVHAVAVDETGVYVAGYTYGHLFSTSTGGIDAFIQKFDADGNPLWARQFGSNLHDFANSIAVSSSGIYVGGYTYGALTPSPNAGGVDGFLRKYDSSGNHAWTIQLGTPATDVVDGLAADANGVYVAAYTEGTLPGQTKQGGIDAVIQRYTSGGSAVWTRQFGAAGLHLDVATAVTLDATGVYVVGYTDGTLTGAINTNQLADVFVRKYGFAGDTLWTRQFGTPAVDITHGVFADGTYVFLTGSTSGGFPGHESAGGTDIFLVELDPAAPYNEPPVARAGPNRNFILGETVAFDGSASYDPDGSIASYLWEFGDGGTSSSAAVNHVYSAAGSFTATLTVTDDEGESGSDTTLVTVITHAEAIDSLAALVSSFNFQQGISNSLDEKLQNAKDALNAANAGQRQDALNKLQAFINAVDAQRGRELTSAQADQLLALAIRIVNAMVQ